MRSNVFLHLEFNEEAAAEFAKKMARRQGLTSKEKKLHVSVHLQVSLEPGRASAQEPCSTSAQLHEPCSSGLWRPRRSSWGRCDQPQVSA